MAYKYGVQLSGQDHLSFNAVVFGSEDEADSAGRELLSRWFAPIGYEVVKTDDPVNYSFIDGRPERIEA